MPEPCIGVFVAPGDDLPALVASKPAGTTFCLGTGVHRLVTPVIPRAGDRFIGEPGAIVSGAKDVSTSFAKSGAFWAATGMTMEEHEPVWPPAGITDPCRVAGSDVCAWQNDVFVEDAPLVRVMTKGELAPGRFFFDYPADTIWLGDDPAGRRVEVGVTARAFAGAAAGGAGPDVVIRRLVVEKFANRVQTGAIQSGKGWIVEDCEVRLNHGIGIQGGQVMRRNHVHQNGQMGISLGGEDGALVEDNEIDRNEYAQVGCWEGGGSKFLWTKNLTVRGNHVHHHTFCPGLWTDTDNIYVLYEKNVAEDNGGPGIFHEASFDAVIRDNVVRRNGFDASSSAWLDGSGILVNSSRNTEITGNLVEDNRHGIGATFNDRGSSATYGVREVRNLFVHDNDVRMTNPAGSAAGLATCIDAAYGSPYGNRFESNTYRLCAPTVTFVWAKTGGCYASLTKEQWLGFGQDAKATFPACP